MTEVCGRTISVVIVRLIILSNCYSKAVPQLILKARGQHELRGIPRHEMGQQAIGQAEAFAESQLVAPGFEVGIVIRYGI